MTDYDPEYVISLWDYTRQFESVEQCVQIMAGNSVQAHGEGVEALESYHMPEVGSAPRVTKQHLASMPPKLGKKVWRHELEVLNDVISMADPDKWSVFNLISWLDIGNAVFDDVDVEDRRLEAIQALPECESKIDMLEKYDEITGEEWFDRASELAG